MQLWRLKNKIMSIAVLNNVSLTIANTNILQNVNWQIEKNQRIALLGRNGAGKSSLLKLLLGEHTTDSGSVQLTSNATVCGLAQDAESSHGETVYENLVSGLGETGSILAKFRTASINNLQDNSLQFQADIDNLEAWDLIPKVENIATRLDIDINAKMEELSGGMRRRVLLAAAIIAEPQLLLLDEPTNHLDIQSIEWLSSYLNNYPSSVLFVTHDREFLKEIATQIVELDRGKIYTYDCSYEKYLDRREAMLISQRRHNDLFDKRLQLEEDWIRQGIKARRTRNEGRVRRLEAMREEHNNRRNELRKIEKINVDVSRSSKIVIEAKNVSYNIDSLEIIKDLSLLITKGDKIGIIGPNGCGKTTLINLLLGEIAPDSGNVRRSESLQVAYFDQLRRQLDMNKTVMDNVAEGSTHVTINGKQKHVASYLQDFLFSKEKLAVCASQLSGGECNRLLLAKLFSKPVNLIVLDEPTNDLDVESLELLENILAEYAGTLLLISHDRKFINQVVTSVLVYCDDHKFHEFVGGYSDYKRISKQQKVKNIQPKSEINFKKQKKLSYNEQRELAALPGKIEKIEAEISDLQNLMLEADFFNQPTEQITLTQMGLQELEKQLEDLYTRWEDLDADS